MQTKRNSLIEATVSTLVGIGVNYLASPIINHSLGICMSHSQIVFSTLGFTALSLIRSYLLRRIFNRIKN